MRVFRDGITYDINKFRNTENGPDEKKFAFFVAKSLSGHNVGGRLQDNVIPSSDFGY